MSIKLTTHVRAVLSRQDLSSDAVTYEIEIDLLGIPLRVDCPPDLIARLDQVMAGPAQPQPQQQQRGRRTQHEDRPEYNIGQVEEYDVEDNI